MIADHSGPIYVLDLYFRKVYSFKWGSTLYPAFANPQLLLQALWALSISTSHPMWHQAARAGAPGFHICVEREREKTQLISDNSNMKEHVGDLVFESDVKCSLTGHFFQWDLESPWGEIDAKVQHWCLVWIISWDKAPELLILFFSPYVWILRPSRCYDFLAKLFGCLVRALGTENQGTWNYSNPRATSPEWWLGVG